MSLIWILVCCGCSHTHRYRIPITNSSTNYPPIELSAFFIENGLEEGQTENFPQLEKKGLTRIWINGETRVFEYKYDDIYEVNIEPWSFPSKTSAIAKKLNELLEGIPHKTTFDYDKGIRIMME